MPVTSETLSNVAKILDANSCDFALGIREDTINDFLDAHFRAESASPKSVYKGEGHVDALKLGYKYEVQAAATLDISPISPTAFSKIFSSWIAGVPELARYFERPADPGPHISGLLADAPTANVQVYARRVHLDINTDTEGITVALDFSIKVTAFAEVVHEAGRTFVRLTPIAARIDEPGRFLADLDKKLEALGLLKDTEKNSDLAALDDGGKVVDDPNCVSLRKLIFYIANVVIAGRISQFVQNFEIPVPIKLIPGVEISTVDLEAVENLFVVLATVSVTQMANEMPNTLFECDPEDMLPALEQLKSADELMTLQREDAAEFSVVELQKSKNYPDRGVFVLLHERLLQKLANKYLVISKRNEHCGGWTIFKYCYGWFVRTFDPLIELVNARLVGFISIQGGGWIKGCIHTHCGNICKTVSATLNGRPGVAADFQFRNRNELWVIAHPIPFIPNWQIGGLPWPFNKLIGFFLDILTVVIEGFLLLLKNSFTFRVFTFPAEVPGLPIKIAAKFDANLIAGPKLVIAVGELDFEPS